VATHQPLSKITPFLEEAPFLAVVFDARLRCVYVNKFGNHTMPEKIIVEDVIGMSAEDLLRGLNLLPDELIKEEMQMARECIESSKPMVNFQPIGGLGVRSLMIMIPFGSRALMLKIPLSSVDSDLYTMIGEVMGDLSSAMKLLGQYGKTETTWMPE
jgi:hypothetical protein